MINTSFSLHSDMQIRHGIYGTHTFNVKVNAIMADNRPINPVFKQLTAFYD